MTTSTTSTTAFDDQFTTAPGETAAPETKFVSLGVQSRFITNQSSARALLEVPAAVESGAISERDARMMFGWSRTGPTDTEMLDWLISSRMRIVYVHQADATRYVCRNWSFSELNDHTAIHHAYDTPRKAIEAAMIDTGSKAFLSGLGRA